MGELSNKCIGRWPSLLPALGVDARHLTGKHGPCPVQGCGGTDRFRFDDKGGAGTFFCSRCGAGDGLKLAMLVNGQSFAEIACRIKPLLPSTNVIIPKASERADKSGWLASIWAAGSPLSGTDPASKYLLRRGLQFTAWPDELRWHRALPDVGTGGVKTRHPALLARMLGPDGRSFTIQVTYLTSDGRKAAVDPVRKTLGPVPGGGAVRLFGPGPVLGIAEGVETALAASIMHGVPVWAALNDGNLNKWEPPANVEQVLIFGDNDASFAGQLAAYSLARRLNHKGRTCDVRLPERLPNDGKGTDWLDVLNARQRAEIEPSAPPADVESDDEIEAFLDTYFGKQSGKPEFEEVVL